MKATKINTESPEDCLKEYKRCVVPDTIHTDISTKNARTAVP
jgi:hypothetical protein